MFGTGIEPVSAGPSPVSTAARVYGIELEGLSAEDRDYEIARQLIRFAEAAARQARSHRRRTRLPPLSARHLRAQRVSWHQACCRTDPAIPIDPRSGPWFRRGHTIVLIGLQPDPL